MADRTPEQIRASIEANRAELAVAVTKLRGEVERVRGEFDRVKGEFGRLTDWRSFLERNRTQVLVGVAVAGFVLGGGLAAVGGLARRRNK
ncbi:MAG: DUF3618 domain-containing protein [Solirubrobacteraceae bacterium]|jgi:hypothetical protein